MAKLSFQKLCNVSVKGALILQQSFCYPQQWV